MTVFGALSLPWGVSGSLTLSQCAYEGSKRKKPREQAARRERHEVKVCLQGVGLNNFINWSTASIFPLNSVAEMYSSHTRNNPTTHTPLIPASDTPSTSTSHSTLPTQVARPKFRGHLLPAGGRLSFVVCNRGCGGLWNGVDWVCDLFGMWSEIERDLWLLGWQTMATRTSKTSLSLLPMRNVES